MKSEETFRVDIIPSTRLAWQGWAIVMVAVVLAVTGYIAFSVVVHCSGYPLDDAWIHQTYARNLAHYGEWSFVAGQPSAGSTAPLWSFLIAMGYWLGLSPAIWTYCLGIASLLGVAVGGELLVRRALQGWNPRLPWVGLFLAAEWHLVWAAASGMETAAFALSIVVVLWLLGAASPKWLAVGLLIGTAVWLRPDGLTLLGPALLVMVMQPASAMPRWLQKVGRDAVSLLSGFSLVVIPYLFFNRWLSGSWFPNTFYAKQAEYAVMLTLPFFQRFAALIQLPLIGAGVLLLPGLLYAVICSIKVRRWHLIGVFLWWLGYSLIYVWRLPLDYQHGRYLMPAMPVYFVLGLLGTIWLGRLKFWDTTRLDFVLKRAWLLAVMGVGVGFYGMGANAYAQDVAIIETEMVRVAKWVADNTETDALIAAHDIGALGYFAQRPLLDLAGLVSPDVIPFIRDEQRLAEYIDQHGAAYLVTFPGWYPFLIEHGEPLYQSEGEFAPAAGGENMIVYRWRGKNVKK